MLTIGAPAARATQDVNAPQPRLVRAAHEFEAQLMKELLKPMTGNRLMEGDDEESGSSGVLGEFASEALGRSLSEHGGLGIANSVLRSLSHAGSLSVSGMVSGNTAANQVKSSPKSLTERRELPIQLPRSNAYGDSK
jgi:Rod binding domain-containing protein